MKIVEVFYSMDLFPKMDDRLKRIAKKHSFAVKNPYSGGGGCGRDIAFEFPDEKSAAGFRAEVDRQAGVRATRYKGEPYPEICNVHGSKEGGDG